MRVRRSTMGYTMFMVGDHCYVERVRPGTDAATKLHPGDEVLALNGFQIKRRDFQNMTYFFRILSPAPAEVIDLLGSDGKPRKETLKAMLRPGKALFDLSGTNQQGDIAEYYRDEEDDEHLMRQRISDQNGVLVWKMSSFEVDPAKVDAVFSRAANKKALVIDLRGNGGGYQDTLKAMLSHLFDHDVKLGDLVSRKDKKVEVVKPQSNYFAGPVVVLLDSESASAAELFARVIQLEHRGTVIGDRSSGLVMQARDYSEQFGVDSIIPYAFSITSANILMADGKSLENVGVLPDQLLLPTPADLADGKDPVLSHAIELAGGALDPTAAGKLFPYEWPKL